MQHEEVSKATLSNYSCAFTVVCDKTSRNVHEKVDSKIPLHIIYAGTNFISIYSNENTTSSSCGMTL